MRRKVEHQRQKIVEDAKRMSKTSAWGPSAWKFLFAVAMGFDLNHDLTYKSKVKAYNTFLQSIPAILPCVFCRESAHKSFRKRNLQAYLKKYKTWPLIHYLYDLKNDVNLKLRRQERHLPKSARRTRPSPPFRTVLKKVLTMQATKCSSSNGTQSTREHR